jgi:hypothetical protein
MQRVLRRITFPATAAAVIAATGCGGPPNYSLESSRECLKQTGGIRVRQPPASDLVAVTALGGALNVKFPSNQVTVAFGQDKAEADRLATAYRRFKGKNIGIESALQEERNVVLIWGITPETADRTTVVGCLKS